MTRRTYSLSRKSKRFNKSRRKHTTRKISGGAIICDKLRAQHNYLQLLRMNNNFIIRERKLHHQGLLKRRLIKAILLLFIGVNKSMRILCSKPDIRLTDKHISAIQSVARTNIDTANFQHLKPFALYSKDVNRTAKEYIKNIDVLKSVGTAVTTTSPQVRHDIVKNQIKSASIALDRLMVTGFGIPVRDNVANNLISSVPSLQKFIKEGVSNASQNQRDIEQITKIIQTGLTSQANVTETLDALNRIAGDRGVPLSVMNT